MTGSTSTSLWTVYNNGVRNYCGNELAEGNRLFFICNCSLLLSTIVFVILKGVNTCLCSGMKKNEKLEANIITPTTKAADHDLPISGPEVRDPFHFFNLSVESLSFT